MVLDIVESQGRGGAQKWPKFNMGQNRTSLNVPDQVTVISPPQKKIYPPSCDQPIPSTAFQTRGHHSEITGAMDGSFAIII